MVSQELRLECLRLAVQQQRDPRPDNVIAAARAFEGYLTEVEEAPAQTTKKQTSTK